MDSSCLLLFTPPNQKGIYFVNGERKVPLLLPLVNNFFYVGSGISKLGKDYHIKFFFKFLSGKSCVTSRVTRLKTMQKRTWIGGHKSSVLSLDVSREGILASGGEEELCVWSKDGAPQTKLSCSSAESKEVNSVCFCGKNPERLYASCGNKIFGYDLRNLSSTVCEFEFNEEEINQVTIHDRGTYLAACDDSGEVKVVDVQSGRLFKTLKRKHENISSTVQFRPSRPWEIVSGGMDFKVISWDFSSGRSLQELNVQELGENSQEGAYFVNPPFVHSIHMAGNGRKFASGLGKKVLYVISHKNCKMGNLKIEQL